MGDARRCAGEPAGDTAGRICAELCRGCCKEHDAIAPHGGQENGPEKSCASTVLWRTYRRRVSDLSAQHYVVSGIPGAVDPTSVSMPPAAFSVPRQIDVFVPAQGLPTRYRLYEIPEAAYVVGAMDFRIARMQAALWSASDSGLPPWKPYLRVIYGSTTARLHAPSEGQRSMVRGRDAEEARERLNALRG